MIWPDAQAGSDLESTPAVHLRRARPPNHWLAAECIYDEWAREERERGLSSDSLGAL